MPVFSYRATDSAGATVQGTVEAVSSEAALDALRSQGLVPIDVTEEAHTAPNAVDLSTFAPHSMSASAEEPAREPEKTEQSRKAYLPIAATLRLYAGWLLAYYMIVYAMGWYARSRPLPREIPFVEALLLSPLVLSFTLAAFLFLLGHTLVRALGGGCVKGGIVTVLGVGTFVLYRMNVA